MLKIGIQSNAYFTYGNGESEGLAAAKAHGYDCLDYQDICGANSPLFALSATAYEKYLTDLGKCAKDVGITFWQAHGLWGKDDTTEQLREQNLTYYKRQIEGCAYLGCKRLVVHPCMPFGWGTDKEPELTFEMNVEVLQQLLPWAKEYGVIVCLENMPFPNPVSTTGDMKRVVRAVDSPFVKICLDTGHAHVKKENIYQSVLTAADDLAALHVHDNWGNGEDRHYIPFQGSLDWDGFVKGLNEIGFNGCLSLETFVAMKTPEPMREQMRVALVGLAKYLAAKVGK